MTTVTLPTRKRAECDRVIAQMREQVTWIQQQVDEMARRCLEELPKLDEQFCRGLPELPRGEAMVQFARDLPGLIARRFEARIKLNSACAGTLDTGYQLLKSGKVDLLAALELYAHVGLSAFGDSQQSPRAA